MPDQSIEYDAVRAFERLDSAAHAFGVVCREALADGVDDFDPIATTLREASGGKILLVRALI